jgi:hypothetical protein
MNISVIIPIHEYNDELSLLVTNAVESVLKQEDIEVLPTIALVYPTELDSNITGFRDSMVRKYSSSGVTHQNFVLIQNDGKTDYQSQVNFAVENITTDYFSVLEFDDEYSISYFRNVEKYLRNYPEIDVFLTMMIEVNEKNEGIKLTNETVWAQQFVGENGEIGYLNINSLKQYTDFKLSGGVIKTSEFLNLGKYKTNIKLTFMYEFLLRALNNASKVFAIPKIGYKHLATREGSLFDDYQKTMPIEERKFWFETATKESNFTNDRPIDLSRLEKVVVK